MSAVVSVRPADAARPWEVVQASPTRRAVSVARARWPSVVGGVAALLYAAVGIVLMYGHGYVIADGINRSGLARMILFGRDPHLAAIGAAWMPLPTLAELPLMALLGPLGLAPAVGPITSALFAAATLVVLARIGTHLGMSSRLTALIVVLYGFNPVVIFWSGTGMSESPSAFFLCLALLAFLRWTDGRSSAQLALMGLALALATLTRYENAPVFVVAALAVGLHEQRGRRAAAAVVVALPSLFALFVWFAVLQALRGDFLIGYKMLAAVGTPSEDGVWLPSERTLGVSFAYVVERLLYLAPVALVAIPLVLFDDVGRMLQRRRLAPVGVLPLVVAGIFPGSVGILLLLNKTYGNLRYFFPLVAPLVICVMWLLRRDGRFSSSGWKAILVVFLVAGPVTATAISLDQQKAYVEKEHMAFGALFGDELQPGANMEAAMDLDDYRAAARWLDERVGATDVVALETASSTRAFGILAFTEHPDRFAISEDRDYEQLLQLDDAPFTYIAALQGASAPARVLSRLSTPSDGGAIWQEAARFGDSVIVYHLSSPTSTD